MAISFGSATGADVVDGGTIDSVAPLGMADLMKKADGILGASQEALLNMTRTTASLRSIGSKIDGGEGTVGALINDKSLYAHMDETTRGLRDTVSRAQA